MISKKELRVGQVWLKFLVSSANWVAKPALTGIVFPRILLRSDFLASEKGSCELILFGRNDRRDRLFGSNLELLNIHPF